MLPPTTKVLSKMVALMKMEVPYLLNLQPSQEWFTVATRVSCLSLQLGKIPLLELSTVAAPPLQPPPEMEPEQKAAEDFPH